MLTFNRLFQSLRNLVRAQTGNVVITVALVTPMLLVAGGAGIDLIGVAKAKSRLQSAADAAALAAIANGSAAFNVARGASLNVGITEGVNQATAAFNANIQNATGFGTPTVTYTVSRTATDTMTAVVTASADYTLAFGTLLGVASLPVTASSTAQTGLNYYSDFFVMVDVSGSMGLPSDAGEQARFALNNPDERTTYYNTAPSPGCAFACHFPYSSGYAGYSLSREGLANWNVYHYDPTRYVTGACPTTGLSYCYQLRIDAVAIAMDNLVTAARGAESFFHQYRVGVYPFINDVDTSFAPLTNNLTGSGVGAIVPLLPLIPGLLDTGANPTLGSGGTHFDTAMNHMLSSNVIPTGGVGTQANPKNVVFLITDGMQDSQVHYPGGGWTGVAPATIPQASCTAVKNRATLAILYLPYSPLNARAASPGSGDDVAANGVVPNILAQLKLCATSPDLVFTANTTADISSELQTMFTQTITKARVTN